MFSFFQGEKSLFSQRSWVQKILLIFFPLNSTTSIIVSGSGYCSDGVDDSIKCLCSVQCRSYGYEAALCPSCLPCHVSLWEFLFCPSSVRWVMSEGNWEKIMFFILIAHTGWGDKWSCNCLFIQKQTTYHADQCGRGQGEGKEGGGRGVKLSSYQVITMCLCVRPPASSDPADM